MAWRHIFRQISIQFTASWWFYPCLPVSWRTFVYRVDTISSWCIWSENMECQWIHVSVTSCFASTAFWTDFRCISVVLKNVVLPFIRTCETLRFIRIMHDCMLLVLFTFLDIKKCSTATLACTFSADVLAADDWSMVVELVARHLTPVTNVNELWVWLNLHGHLYPISERLNDQAYSSYYWGRK